MTDKIEYNKIEYTLRELIDRCAYPISNEAMDKKFLDADKTREIIKNWEDRTIVYPSAVKNLLKELGLDK